MVSGDDLLVDLALDSAPNLPSATSLAGPTFALEELACRKLLALFDRAEARDFTDVFVLAKRYRIELILDVQPRSMQDSTQDPGDQYDPT